MKKMLLVSMFQIVLPLLKSIEPNLKNKTITYIPTAYKVENLRFLFKLGKLGLEKQGLLLDELDISSASYETIKSKLEKNDVIYVPGGNTFYLLQEMKRTGADKLLIEEVNKGKLYIGESAGAIVVAPDIEYSSAMDSKEKAPDLKEYSGLGLIDFYVVPHSENWSFNKAVKRIISTYSSTLDLKIIRDSQAILIENDNVHILGK